MSFRKSIFIALSYFIANESFACDPCALYNASQLLSPKEDSLTLALSEQFSSYDLAKDNLKNTKSNDLTKGYSTTQLTAIYDLNESFGAQVSIPFVIRNFDEILNFHSEDKTETGLGDISIAASYTPISIRKAEKAFILSFDFGIKLPTGDSGSLESSIDEVNAKNTYNNQLAHHQIAAATGLNGRVLSIGTGSFDYIFASSFTSRFEKLLLLGSVQYTLKTEGDFNYRFDNDFFWDFGPGAYLVLNDDYATALRISVSGEHKGQDTYQGSHVEGSQISNLYWGPEVILSLPPNLSLNLALDLPLDTNDKANIIEPDYRIRTSVSYRF